MLSVPRLSRHFCYFFPPIEMLESASLLIVVAQTRSIASPSKKRRSTRRRKQKKNKIKTKKRSRRRILIRKNKSIMHLYISCVYRQGCFVRRSFSCRVQANLRKSMAQTVSPPSFYLLFFLSFRFNLLGFGLLEFWIFYTRNKQTETKTKTKAKPKTEQT